MSISILKQPLPFQPAYNNTVLILDSDSKTEDSFEFIIDINVGGVYIDRLEVSPNIEGYGVIQLGRILESYVSYDLDHTTNKIFNQIPNSYANYDVVLSEKYKVIIDYSGVTDNGGFCQYNFPSAHNYSNNTYITITESSSAPSYNGNQYITSVVSSTSIITNKEYDVTATGTTQLSNGGTTIITGATVMSGSNYVNNMVESWFDYRTFDYSDYIMQTGTTGEFLSSIQDETTVKSNDRLFINTYNHSSNSCKFLKVTTSNGSEYIILNAYNASTDSTKFLSIGVGPWNLKNTQSVVTTLGSSILPIIQYDVTSYTVELLDHLSATTSVVKTINIEPDSCKRYSNYNFLYLDKKGSFLNFNFDSFNQKTKSYKRTSYIKGIGSYDFSSNEYTYNSWDKGKVNLDIDIRERYKATSDWVTELEGDRIIDLYESPETYILTDETITYEYDTEFDVLNYIDNGGLLQIQVNSHPYVAGDWITLTSTAPEYENIDMYVNSDDGANIFTVTFPYDSNANLTGGDKCAKRLGGTTIGGELLAVNILTNSTKVKQKVTEKNINYIIDFEYSNKNTVQRG